MHEGPVAFEGERQTTHLTASSMAAGKKHTHQPRQLMHVVQQIQGSLLGTMRVWLAPTSGHMPLPGRLDPRRLRIDYYASVRPVAEGVSQA